MICNPHPAAPHGFDRNASHDADTYVCLCESWAPGDESTTQEAPAPAVCDADPNAPHGFDREASLNAGQYVCRCQTS